MEWKPIETAPLLERIWVCGWSPDSKWCKGYWWFHEDATGYDGPIEHPGATHWCEIVLPPFPEPPCAE